jgi:hypothetical protein
MFREDPSCIYRPPPPEAVRRNIPQIVPLERVAVAEP